MKDGQANWHARPFDEALETLGSSRNGLSPHEAARRLSEAGPNQLPTRRPEGRVKRILRQFKNVLIYVLLAAAFLSVVLGEWVDAAVILAVVLANAVVGYIR